MESFLPACGVRLRDRLLLGYARGLEHPAKVRIFHWLSRGLTGSRLHVRHGWPVTFRIDPADYIGWTIVRTGAYEPETLNLAVSLMRAQPGLFVDVGANFGLFTCAIAAIAGTAIVSLEPDAANCAELRRNIAINGLTNVAVREVAASAKAMRVELVRRSARNSGTVAMRLAPGLADPQGQWVEAKPLKDILREAAPPNLAPMLVKIDVEGFEREVLEGLVLSGPQRPRNIIFEYTAQWSHHSWPSFNDVREYFSSRSYLLTDVLGRPIRDEGRIPEYNVWARAVDGAN